MAWLRRALLHAVRYGLLLAGLASAAAGALGAPLPLGTVQTVVPLANGADFALSDGATLRIEFLAGGMVRLHAQPAEVAPLVTGAIVGAAPAAGQAELFQDANQVVLRQADLYAVVQRAPLQVLLLRGDGSVLFASLPGGLQHDRAAGTAVLLAHARPGERFYGLGLNGGPLDRRGRRLLMRNTDRAAYDETTNPLYSSTPFLYGHLHGATHGLYVDTPAVASFDVAATAGEVLSVAANGGTLDCYVMAGPTPADVAAAFATLTGATPVPPRWALGYTQAHFGYASAEEVLSLASEFRARAIPADAFFLDLDYTDRLFTLTWHPTAWPDPVGFNQRMAAMGFRTVNILEPLVTVFDPLWPWLAGNGWLVKGPDGAPLVTNIWMGDVSYIDFTQAGARTFFRQALSTFVGTGVAGLWADLNEPAANELPYAVFDFDGRPRYEYTSRNVYALWEAATLRDALLDARPGERTFIVSRSGFPGIQRYAANWSGDTESTWDSLRVQVQIANAMGLSGQNFFGADVGGFLGAPDAELFLRWLQFGVATPFLRNHSMNTSPLREPWRFGEPVTSAARAIIEWRYRLMPYLYGLFVQAEQQGRPVLAPPFFHFPGDALTHDANSEFMLGPSLLVAPVTTPGAVSRLVRLPAGSDWVDVHTDTRHSGGQTIVLPAPLQQVPALARLGAVMPTGPVRQHAQQVVGDESLVIDVYAGASGEFTMRDDDGQTLAYRQGDHRDTRLQWTETAAEARFTTQVVAGTRAAPLRPWWLQVRLWPQAPTRVSADGLTLPRVDNPLLLGTAGGWAYDAANRRLLVRLPGQAAAALVRVER